MIFISLILKEVIGLMLKSKDIHYPVDVDIQPPVLRRDYLYLEGAIMMGLLKVSLLCWN